MRIVLTRERGANATLRSWLPVGATIDEVPLTETRYVEYDVFHESLADLEDLASLKTLVVTSARAASYAPSVLAALHGEVTVASVGMSTTAALGAVGVRCDVMGNQNAASLAPSIHDGPVLLLGALETRPELVEALEANGLGVRRLPCYETIAVTLSPADEEVLRAADVVVIGAPSTWHVARGLVRDDALVVVPGATTSAEVRADHERVLECWGPALREHLNAL